MRLISRLVLLLIPVLMASCATIEHNSHPQAGMILDDCIRITAVNVSHPDSAGAVALELVWKNVSGKEIKYAVFQVVPYNAAGEELSCRVRGNRPYTGRVTGPVAPGQTYSSGIKWRNAWFNPSISYAAIHRVNIEFMDGELREFNKVIMLRPFIARAG